VPLQEEIDELVREVEGAIGAIIVDSEGEAVVSAAEDFSTYDLQVVGAYGGIFLDHIRRISRENAFGIPTTFVIDAENARLLHQVLRDGYFIVVVLRNDACLSVARRRLQICHDRLIEEF
jgi:predicted regulator of Ras-like GTPase activity (Roadblock/LC7/MglB family)